MLALLPFSLAIMILTSPLGIPYPSSLAVPVAEVASVVAEGSIPPMHQLV